MPDLMMSSIDIDHAVDRAPDAAGQADDAALAVADARDAVQGPFDAGSVVAGELADAISDVSQVIGGDFVLAQDQSRDPQTGLRQPAQVHDDFKQVIALVRTSQRLLDARRQHVQQRFQVVGNLRVAIILLITFWLCTNDRPLVAERLRQRSASLTISTGLRTGQGGRRHA